MKGGTAIPPPLTEVGVSLPELDENLMDDYCHKNRAQIYRNYVDYSQLRKNCHLIDVDNRTEAEVLVAALKYVCPVIF